MRKQYIQPTLNLITISPMSLMAVSNVEGYGLGADIQYGGEDEDGTVIPSVKSNPVSWSDWE